MTHRNTWIGALLISLALVGLIAAEAHERQGTKPAASIEKSFAARTVTLNNIAAELHIDSDDGADVRVRASGSERVVEALRLTNSDRTLEIAQPASGTVATNTVHVERNVVITRDGGTSNVIIGGTTANDTRRAPLLSLHVTVPRETPVTVSGFTGRARLGSFSAPVAFELLSGSLSAASLGKAHLAIAGGGALTVARVDGDLDLEIAGSGEITVEDGNIPSLSLDTSGASTVFIGGRVDAARLSLNGVSDVTVAEIMQEPVVDANGVVTVRIGNR